jgi:hypothetical protein
MRNETSTAVDTAPTSALPYEGETKAAETSIADLDRGEPVETKIENQQGDEHPARRRRRGKRKLSKPTELDADARFRKRLPYLVGSKKFRTWIKQNYPAIRHRSELTPEIIDQYDDYDIATVRQRAEHRPEPIDPELAEFVESAFTYVTGEGCWTHEFRRWVANKHRLYHKHEITRAIMEEWRAYESAKLQEYAAKADFDYKELDPEEFQAGINQWVWEKHRYLDGFPNTRAEWAALIQRSEQREAAEAAEAAHKAAAEQTEAAERRRKVAQVERLKAFKLPSVKGPVPKLVAIGAAREEHDNEKLQLSKTWCGRFAELPGAVQIAWKAYHDFDEASWDAGGDLYLAPRGRVVVDAERADEVCAGLRDPKFAEFQRFNEGVRRALNSLDEKLERLVNPPPDAYLPHRGYTLDEIEDEGERYVLAGVVPEGLAVLYGAPKAGKSAWAQKLSACVSSAAPFDGADVAHGRVLYVSCDTGARCGAVKRRLRDILSRLKLPSNKNMVIVEDPVILNDAASVTSLLEQNPGKFILVVIDPLYQCVTGSLVQDAVMMEAIKGLSTISRATGAAVLLIHHEPRGSQHLFGSMLLDAALDAQIHVDRDKDVVTVKVELLKNGQPPKRPFVYQMEAGYLAPATLAMGGKDAATGGAPSAEKDRYAQILERLPEIAIRESEARKLNEGLLTGKTPAAKRQAWHRALKAMTKAGLVTRRQGMVQRRQAREP